MFGRSSSTASAPAVGLPAGGQTGDGWDVGRELYDAAPARKLAALGDIAARVPLGKAVEGAFEPVVRGCLASCTVPEVRAAAYRALRSMGVAQGWAAVAPHMASDFQDARPKSEKVRVAALRTLNAIPAAEVEEALEQGGAGLLAAVECETSSGVRRAAIEACGFLLLHQLPPEAAARSSQRQRLADIWTAILEKLFDKSSNVCLASVQIVRSLFLKAQAGDGVWLPLASFVRASLQPRLALLLNRLCSLGVRHRASCIVPLLYLVVPVDAQSTSRESKQLNGLTEANMELAREVVTQHFLPQLQSQTVGVVHEVAQAVLRIGRLMGWRGVEAAVWARASCSALLRVACCQDSDVLETCAVEVSESLHRVGRQYELPYALELLRVVRRLPQPELRLDVMMRLLRVIFERALVQPPDEPSVVRLLLEDPWLRGVMNGEGSTSAPCFREEVVLSSIEAMLLLAQTTDCIRFRGSGGSAAPDDAWLEPALALAETLSDCLWWRCDAGGNDSSGAGDPPARVGAQLACLRLVAKLCHVHHRVQRAVIHDGVPHRRLQLLLEKLKEGCCNSDSPQQRQIAAEPIRLRLLWVLAQHLSLRDERETTVEAAGLSEDSLLGLVRHRLLRVDQERRYIRWLESAATRGVVGSDGATESAVGVTAELGETALALRCLHFVGLRSLSHARLCIQVIDEFEDSGRSSSLAALQTDSIRRQLTFALTHPEGYDWLLGVNQPHLHARPMANITHSSRLDAAFFPDVDALERGPSEIDALYDGLLQSAVTSWQGVPTSLETLQNQLDTAADHSATDNGATDTADENEQTMATMVVSGGSDPLYVEAGQSCVADSSGTTLRVHIRAWNRTESSVTCCRLVADASSGLQYLGDDPLSSDAAMPRAGAEQQSEAMSAVPARAIRLIPELPPGECFRCSLPYSMKAFARHQIRLRFALAEPPADVRPQPRRDHLAITCAPVYVPLWHQLRPAAVDFASYLQQWARLPCVYVCMGWLADGATLETLAEAIAAKPFRVVATRRSSTDPAQCQLAAHAITRLGDAVQCGITAVNMSDDSVQTADLQRVHTPTSRATLSSVGMRLEIRCEAASVLRTLTTPATALHGFLTELTAGQFKVQRDDEGDPQECRGGLLRSSALSDLPHSAVPFRPVPEGGSAHDLLARWRELKEAT